LLAGFTTQQRLLKLRVTVTAGLPNLVTRSFSERLRRKRACGGCSTTRQRLLKQRATILARYVVALRQVLVVEDLEAEDVVEDGVFADEGDGVLVGLVFVEEGGEFFAVEDAGGVDALG